MKRKQQFAKQSGGVRHIVVGRVAWYYDAQQPSDKQEAL